MKKKFSVDKNVEMSLLLDFYGGLLTDKQSNCMHMHYDNDMSLSEIADIEKISRQAVHDTLKRAEEILLGYERKLRFSAVYKKQSDLIDKYENEPELLKVLQEMILAWEE